VRIVPLLTCSLLFSGCTDPIYLDADAGLDASAADGGSADADAAPPCGADCALSFDVAHVPIELHLGAFESGTASSHYAAELSDDGQILFFTRVSDNGASGELIRAQRAYEAASGTYTEFGRATAETFETAPPGPILRATVSGDTLRTLVEIDVDPGDTVESRIYEASRTSAGPFGPLREVPAFSEGGFQAPTLSRDGLQVVVELAGELFLSRRADVDEDFTDADNVGVPRPATDPRLSADGLVLTYEGNVTQREVTRSSVDVAFEASGAPSRFASALGEDGFLPFHSPVAAELWYTLGWPMYPELPALGAVLMRVRTCEGPCATQGRLPCDAEETPSDDGLRCYSLISPSALTTGEDWPREIAIQCADLGRTAAAVHVPVETAAIASLLGDDGVTRAYIGLRQEMSRWRWASGQRYFGGPWMPTPAPSHVGAVFDIDGSWPVWEPVAGNARLPGVCERDVWPRWPAPGP
jgi:hypothetical protein